MNRIVVGNGTFDITDAYRRGALAFRLGLDYKDEGRNPFEEGEPEFTEYALGYGFEQRGAHVRHGIDVITASPNLEMVFKEDAGLPADEKGNVDPALYREALSKAVKSLGASEAPATAETVVRDGIEATRPAPVADGSLPNLPWVKGVNHILVGDTYWPMLPTYYEGARAARDGLDLHDDNPYEDGSVEGDAWYQGFVNEIDGEHLRFGTDLLSVDPSEEKVFEIDPDVPRDENGTVDIEWAAVARYEYGVRTVMKGYHGTIWVGPGGLKDEMHEVTPAYRKGAMEARNGTLFPMNRYRSGSADHASWKAGYDNEVACEHFRYGYDLIKVSPLPLGQYYRDESVPRDRHGKVDRAWYKKRLREFCLESYMKLRRSLHFDDAAVAVAKAK